LIRVDALAYGIQNFIEKCRRARRLRVFIGLDTINSANLLHAWRAASIITFCGYILGFPEAWLHLTIEACSEEDGLRNDLQFCKLSLRACPKIPTKNKQLARPGGLEPPTHSLEGCCSIQLS
jgi:hypothetical protein